MELKQITDKHNVVFSKPIYVIGTDCIGRCKQQLPCDHGYDDHLVPILCRVILQMPLPDKQTYKYLQQL
jgi:hypothetical protein